VSVTCPYCNLINPEGSVECDCGYRFGEVLPSKPAVTGPWWRRLIMRWKLRRRTLKDLLTVEYDAERVRVIDRLDLHFNQAFRWNDVVRVCFQDGGMYASDVLFIELRGREKPVIILTEANGYDAFFGELCDCGLFPEKVWRRALGDTSGGTHCWPPRQETS
jgi:hypothetical protein